MIAKSVRFLFGLVVCGVLAAPVIGHAEGQRWKVVSDTPEAFEAQAAKVREDMGTDGQYGAISVADRSAVEADLDKIDALLRSKGSAKALDDKEQIDLMNAQERINAVLTNNDGNRLICKMEQRSGTHFKQKVCQTARERESIRRKSQEGFQRELMRGGGTQAPGN